MAVPLSEQAYRREPNQSLQRLRVRYDLNQRQKDLMRLGQVTPELERDWEAREKFGQPILASAEALRAKAGTSLRFAELPKSLTLKTMTNTIEGYGMNFLTVPVFPLATADAAKKEFKSKGPLRKLYQGYLGGVANGEVPANTSGHYAFIDTSGDSTPLSKKLGLDALNDVSLVKIELAVAEKGDTVLEEMGLKGWDLGVITVEEALLSKALANPVEGITSTALRDTEDFVQLTRDGYLISNSIQTDISPRLVIRSRSLSRPQYLH